MAEGVGLAVTMLSTSGLLHRSVIDPHDTGMISLGCTFASVAPPRRSTSALRVGTSRVSEIQQSWHAKRHLFSLQVVIDDNVAATGSISSEELISDDREHPQQQQPNSREERQESSRPDKTSGEPSSTGSRHVTQGEGETPFLNENQRWAIVKTKLAEMMSNAEKQAQGMHRIRHSLGVDLGDSRTGVAISLKGYAPRPLTVLQFKGDKLIDNLLQIAFKERADEFIMGLPISFEGKETSQSNKTRSFAGKLAAQAAQRGLRVYLLDEYGSSRDGLDYMLDIGIKKKSRREKVDAYAALVLLHSYFSSKGAHAKFVVPKGLDLQERLCLGDHSIMDDLNIDDEF